MKQLGINQDLDKLAAKHGLGHWSCTDPINAVSWLRSDGAVMCNSNWRYPFLTDSKYRVLDGLRGFDNVSPIGKDRQQPEKVIVSRGCHDCPFSSTTRCTITLDINISSKIERERHPQCPLLTNDFKVVKNDD